MIKNFLIAFIVTLIIITLLLYLSHSSDAAYKQCIVNNSKDNCNQVRM